MSQPTLTLGTRGSELALTQTRMVTDDLQAAHANLQVVRQIIQTSGDKRQDLRFSEFNAVAHVDKGIFIKELEIALENSEIDAAVHSLKDVPSDLAAGFVIAAVLPRAPIEDVLITREACTLETLPKGARVGTSSVRRAAQLKWLRPDVEIVEIRGNVPTRVKKVLGEQPLDAVLLAAAGLIRLGLMEGSQIQIEGHTLSALTLDPVTFLPAAGQGAIAIECRAGDETSIQAVRALNHAETEARVTVEREFLRLLGAGCQTPVGAHTWISGDQLTMAVRVFNEADLSVAPVELEATGPVSDPKALAATLAKQVLG
ncbi:hydroxymethylbilane synthase [Prosthecobacter dejongeii]|uniref:Porphobilinogen deaminase n=1 Tax=Prosthecobacter dejongeii TaxID=48465 RepID=A0A7W7YI51_9BACT|nr:hydroxymethylbilane synthase [Prosthecobacter dejongeii]MBB5036532.1 hydroxymethylbilane synthase [Prosthecobacter dejongeii]